MDTFITEYNDDNIKSIIIEKERFFHDKIQSQNLEINSKTIKWKKYPLVDRFDGTYFHIITKSYLNQDISCCPNRIISCPRIFSYNPLMDPSIPDNKKRAICPHKIQCIYVLEKFFENPQLLSWDNMETTPQGRRKRIKFLDEEKKYIVILEEKPNGSIVFWTAYPIDYNHKVEKLKKQFYRYIHNGGLPYNVIIK